MQYRFKHYEEDIESLQVLRVLEEKKCADQNLNSHVWTMYVLNIIHQKPYKDKA